MTTEEQEKEALRLKWEDVREKIARREAGRQFHLSAAFFFAVLGGVAGGFMANDVRPRSPLDFAEIALAAGWTVFWFIYARLQKSSWRLLREEKELRFKLTGEDRRSDDDYFMPVFWGVLLMVSIFVSIVAFIGMTYEGTH